MLCCMIVTACSNFKFFTLKQKLEFLPTAFAVILSAVALLVVHTFELNFEVILYITFFLVQEVQEAALNLRSVFKTHLTAYWLRKHKDFVFTFKGILNFHVRTCWPQNYSFDSFLIQAGHLVFLQGNQRKNNKTNCLNNFSFIMSKNVQHKTAYNVTLSRFSQWSR